MDLALLVLRIVVGGLFVGHGAQKLFGMFGGHGLAGTAGFFDQIGLSPGALHARAAGCAEFFGGALLALGLFTPFAAAAIIATMVAAIVTVHFAKGLWTTEGGYEYNLVLAAAAFALAGAGPGAWSLDHVFSLHLSGAGWGLGALAVGLMGGFGAVASGRARGRSAAHRPPQGGVPA